MQVDLNPPELGRVQVHLSMQDNQVNVRMVVQNDGVKRLMDQQIRQPLRVRFSHTSTAKSLR